MKVVEGTEKDKDTDLDLDLGDMEVSDVAVAHCVHRIHTMSNKALATRIKMIARCVTSCYIYPSPNTTKTQIEIYFVGD